MKTTELKYWVNGYQVRGFGWRKHRTLALQIGNIGVLFATNPSINIFKLI